MELQLRFNYNATVCYASAPLVKKKKGKLIASEKVARCYISV